MKTTDKQVFKDILERGKCKCGEHASAAVEHVCPNESMMKPVARQKQCTCCAYCTEKCKEVLEYRLYHDDDE